MMMMMMIKEDHRKTTATRKEDEEENAPWKYSRFDSELPGCNKSTPPHSRRTRLTWPSLICRLARATRWDYYSSLFCVLLSKVFLVVVVLMWRFDLDSILLFFSRSSRSLFFGLVWSVHFSSLFSHQAKASPSTPQFTFFSFFHSSHEPKKEEEKKKKNEV